jgi:hypothetical protein
LEPKQLELVGHVAPRAWAWVVGKRETRKRKRMRMSGGRGVHLLDAIVTGEGEIARKECGWFDSSQGP